LKKREGNGRGEYFLSIIRFALSQKTSGKSTVFTQHLMLKSTKKLVQGSGGGEKKMKDRGTEGPDLITEGINQLRAGLWT